jgi:hypothetical protein
MYVIAFRALSVYKTARAPLVNIFGYLLLLRCDRCALSIEQLQRLMGVKSDGIGGVGGGRDAKKG